MRNWKWFIGSFAVIVVLVSFWTKTAAVSSAAAQPKPPEGPATHNMVVIGERTVYLSHLPMFQDPRTLVVRPAQGLPFFMPHRYQAILEVTFNNQGTYVKDHQRLGAPKFYTLGPQENFVLPELVSTDPLRRPRRSFRANIFRSHLEKPLPRGQPVFIPDVQVSVQRVVHFREFDPKAKRPATLEYLLFGKGQELFLAHLIVAPPDFDQLLSVKVTGRAFTDQELANGVPMVFPGMSNTPAQRLKAKQKVEGEMKSGGATTATKLQVEVDKEIFFEEGELRMPPLFKTTPEEKLAGFP